MVKLLDDVIVKLPPTTLDVRTPLLVNVPLLTLKVVSIFIATTTLLFKVMPVSVVTEADVGPPMFMAAELLPAVLAKIS